ANNPIAVPKALEILRTGDFKTLLRDPATGRALALKFRDEKSRPCYVLAFSPGEGLAPERRLEPPLAALLTRMVLEATRAGPPFAVVSAANLEAATAQPLPLDWRPGFDADRKSGSGVLDERTSNLNRAMPPRIA